jgi:hypothetical protein
VVLVPFTQMMAASHWSQVAFGPDPWTEMQAHVLVLLGEQSMSPGSQLQSSLGGQKWN